MIALRESSEQDLEAITSIYNDVILTTTAVYSEEPVSLQNRREWWRAKPSGGWQVLVATDEAAVAGFATFGEFRPGPAIALQWSTAFTSALTSEGARWGASCCAASCRLPPEWESM